MQQRNRLRLLDELPCRPREQMEWNLLGDGVTIDSEASIVQGAYYVANEMELTWRSRGELVIRGGASEAKSNQRLRKSTQWCAERSNVDANCDVTL